MALQHGSGEMSLLTVCTVSLLLSLTRGSKYVSRLVTTLTSNSMCHGAVCWQGSVRKSRGNGIEESRRPFNRQYRVQGPVVHHY
jgi:hypothetical protein